MPSGRACFPPTYSFAVRSISGAAAPGASAVAEPPPGRAAGRTGSAGAAAFPHAASAFAAAEREGRGRACQAGRTYEYSPSLPPSRPKPDSL